MSEMSAIILAGGLGTRLQSLVHDRPKPMALIHDRPFLEYLLDYWISQGVGHFILSVGYKHEAIIYHFGKRYQNAKLDYVIESSPLGTGGGLLLAIKKIRKDQRFLLLNGDSYFAVNLQRLNDFAEQHNTDWCFSLFSTTDHKRYLGLELTADGRISAWKKSETSLLSWANGGVYLVHPRGLDTYQFISDYKPISLENDIFPQALAADQAFFGVPYSDTFIDIGIPDDYIRAHQILSGRAYESSNVEHL